MEVDLSKTPTVQKSRRVRDDRRASRRIWNPTAPPIVSPRSFATRSATLMVEMRRGCVVMMLHSPPAAAASSRRNWGTCVVLPHPVGPQITVTACAFTAAKISARLAKAGSCARNAENDESGRGGAEFEDGAAITSSSFTSCGRATLVGSDSAARLSRAAWCMRMNCLRRVKLEIESWIQGAVRSVSCRECSGRSEKEGE